MDAISTVSIYFSLCAPNIWRKARAKFRRDTKCCNLYPAAIDWDQTCFFLIAYG